MTPLLGAFMLMLLTHIARVTMAGEPIRVLMIEDNAGDADLVRELLAMDSTVRFNVTVATRLATGLDLLREDPFDVILLDLDLPDSERAKTFDRVHEAMPHLPVVVHSGSVDDEMATSAVQRGAQDSLVKGRVSHESMSRILRFAIERKRAEEAMLRLEELTLRAETAAAAETLLKGAPIPMIMVGEDLRVRMANEAATRFANFPPEEIVGRLLDNVLGTRLATPDKKPCPIVTLAALALQEGVASQGVELRLLFREGLGRASADVLVSTSCVSLGTERVAVVCLEDVTESRRAEQALRESRDRMRKAQELETIGRLAGGVAHDFNNLLAVILGYAEMIDLRLPSDDKLHEGVAAILEAGRRGASLTRQLLAFGRRQVLRPQVIDLGAAVVETGKMLRRLIGENIALEMDADPDGAKAVADLGQVEQVVMNLAINARDAMPEGGRLILRTRLVEVAPDAVPRIDGARAGVFVRLEVEDTGSGMDAETLQHAFEPFYSLKASGTGLGLPVVYGIVQQHGGWIQVFSQPGQGTRFHVYLPAAAPDAVEIATPEHVAKPLTEGQGELVLVVEDEPALGHLVAESLGRSGYSVRLASRLSEANAIFEQEGARIHMLFSDIVLPDGSGVQLAEQLVAAHPDLAVVLTSGYAADEAQGDRIRSQGFSFVQKPYTLSDVRRAFQEAVAVTGKFAGE